MYIYVHTRVCLCTSAHREERWNWSEVATIVSGYDPTVLSQIAIPNTITVTITPSIATTEELESSHLANVGAIQEWALSHVATPKVETIAF